MTRSEQVEMDLSLAAHRREERKMLYEGIRLVLYGMITAAAIIGVTVQIVGK
jgi:hypothetical protein